MENLGRDIRLALRSLRSTPAFALLVILTLGLGIGANAAIFTVINTVMLKSVAYPNADRLAVVWETQPQRGADYFMYASPPNYADWRDRNRSFETLAAFTQSEGFLIQRDETVQMNGARVSANLLSALGVQPRLGRDFTETDDAPGAERVVLINHSLWRTRFNADPGIVGQTVQLSTGPATVIGVMPESFVFPPPIDREGAGAPPAAEFLVPFAQNHMEVGRGAHHVTVLGVLKQGTSLADADTDMRAIAAQLEAEFPDTNENWTTTIVRMDEAVLGDTGKALLVLFGAVAMVLLIACVNVANLLLARSAARQREYAIRSALGAGRWPLVRQALVESQLLALTGGVVGLLLAMGATRLLTGIAPPNIPLLDRVRIDAVVVLFTIGISLLTGAVFGIVPALRTFSPDLNNLLKQATRGGTASRQEARLRGALVVAEVALSIMLLVGAGLLLKSFVAVRGIEDGVQADNVLTARVNFSPALFPERPLVASTAAQLEETLAALPGVESAGLVFNVPLASDHQGTGVEIEGDPAPGADEDRGTAFTSATPGYFDAMGIPLEEGRYFDARDNAEAAPAIVVNRAFAQKFFAGREAIGRRMLWGDNAYTIVGIVGDVRLESLTEAAPPIVYFAHGQAQTYRSMSIVVRGAMRADALLATVRDAVRSVHSGIPLFEVRTMTDVRDDALAGSRFAATLLLAFSLLALLLAAVGIYGVISFMVTQQAREIGVRMAIGAQAGHEIRRVISGGLKLAVGGVVIGVLGALAGGRVLQSMLYEVRPTDGGVLAGVAITLTLVALAASALPAWRASRTDPMDALRSD